MNKGHRVLVTGANGYLGAQICSHLAKNGFSVLAWCFPTIPNDADWCNQMEDVFVGDLTDNATLEKLLDKDIETIIHLVSMDHHQSQVATPKQALDVNVQPCWNLLNAFSKKGLKRFLYFSTIHVYGQIPSEIIDESRSTDAPNVYALTHAMCESLCAYFNKTTSVQCMVARLSNSYGKPVFSDNNCWWLAVNDLCKNAYQQRCIRLQSDGSPMRDFINGLDVCRAVACLLTQAKPVSEPIYHISSAETKTLLELAGLVQKVYQSRYGQQIPVQLPNGEVVAHFDIYADKPRYTIDNQKLKALGFEPTLGLEQGINDLFDYLEKQ